MQVPALIYSGDSDQLVAVDRNAAALARKLPVTPDYRLLAGAGHFVFMARCDAEQYQRMPVLWDAEGVDRRHIHHSLQRETAAFFSEALGAPQLALSGHGHAAPVAASAQRRPVPAGRPRRRSRHSPGARQPPHYRPARARAMSKNTA